MHPGRTAFALLGAAQLALAAGRLDAQDAPRVTAEPATVLRAPGQLAGTLLAPRTNAKVPVVLLIAGSGPTDRDGNGPGFSPGTLRQLAESLAVRQIATLRFDKRGIGGSASAMIPEAQLTFELLADDVAAWLRQLAADPRFSRVVVAGHSEGALLGLLAMRQAPVARYISLEGPARAADEVLHAQLAKQLPAPMLAEVDSVIARLRSGKTVDAVPPAFAGLFRPSVQPYMISWFKYSARVEIARVTVPCLVVQGTHDLQVAVSEADLLLQANPRCRVVKIAGMNHVLKQAPPDMAGQMASYRTPDAPLAPGLVDTVAAFAHAAGR